MAVNLQPQYVSFNNSSLQYLCIEIANLSHKVLKQNINFLFCSSVGFQSTHRGRRSTTTEGFADDNEPHVVGVDVIHDLDVHR